MSSRWFMSGTALAAGPTLSTLDRRLAPCRSHAAASHDIYTQGPLHDLREHIRCGVQRMVPEPIPGGICPNAGDIPCGWVAHEREGIYGGALRRESHRSHPFDSIPARR